MLGAVPHDGGAAEGQWNLELVRNLRGEIDAVLSRFVAPGDRVALVNFPNHGSPGDSAIWLGTERWLQSHDADVAYACTWSNFDATSLVKAVGGGLVLLNGGGNFGDLYRGQQDTRVEVLTQLRQNPVLQLPQSVCFREDRNATRMAQLVADHGRFFFLARELQSLAWAEEYLEAPSVLCPDMALYSAPRDPLGKPEAKVVWLLRTDLETAGHVVPSGAAQDMALAREWPVGSDGSPYQRDSGPIGSYVVGRVSQHFRGASRQYPQWVRRPLYRALARQWMAQGITALSWGRVAVTDRLHGHILAPMTGVPHVILDNSYGKVRSTWDAWTHGAQQARFAGSAAEAYEMPQSLLAEMSS